MPALGSSQSIRVMMSRARITRLAVENIIRVNTSKVLLRQYMIHILKLERYKEREREKVNDHQAGR